MIRVGDLIEKNREFFQVDDKYSSLTNLILLMTKIMYLCHLFACFWYKIGRFGQNNGEQSWLDQFEGYEETEYLYINAIYYAAITITTVGYGDITPKSKIEKVFIIVMAFISCANFGYALNQIGSIIQEFNSKKEQYRQNIASINKYMKEREVNKLLQSKTRKYFEYIYSQSENLNNQSGNILSKLSSNLQLQIKKEVNLKTLKKIPFLFDTFSKECLEKIAIKINEKCFGIGESIIDQYEVSKPTLYFVIKGEVSIFVKDKQSLYNKIFKQLQQDDIFGEFQFFQQTYDSAYQVTSTGITMVHYLILDDLLSVLEEFPKEREKFCQYKDRVKLYNYLGDIRFSCFSCKSPGHSVDKCPYLMYNPNRDKIFCQFNKEHTTFLQQYKRKKQNKYKLLKVLKYVQYQAQVFKEDMEEEEEEQHQSLHSLVNQSQVLIQEAQGGGSIIKQKQYQQINRASIEQNSCTSFDGKLQSSQHPQSQLQQRFEGSQNNILMNIKGNDDKMTLQKNNIQQQNFQQFVNLIGEQKDKQDVHFSQRILSKSKIDDITNQAPQSTLTLQKLPKKEETGNDAQIQNVTQMLTYLVNEMKNMTNQHQKDQTGKLNVITENLIVRRSMNVEQDDKLLNAIAQEHNKKSMIQNEVGQTPNEGKQINLENSYHHEYGDSYEMDTIKQYEFYFPKNNANKILQDLFMKFNVNMQKIRDLNKSRQKKQVNKRTSKYYQVKK